jgi:hypothetical protein
VWVDDDAAVRKVASMISSLNPTIWRDGSPDAREWKMIFWSACIEISEEVLASNLVFSWKSLACR